MELRTLFIRIKSTFDGKGFDEAAADIDDLGDEAKKTSREVDKLDDELDETARSAQKVGQQSAKAARNVDTLGKQAGQTTRTMGRLDQLMSKAAASVASLGPALAAAGIAAAVQAVGSAIAFVGEKTAELDSIAKRAQQTGFNTDDYQRLAQVATLSGTDVEKLTKGVNNLNVQLSEVARGSTGPAAKALEDLGLSYTALQDRDPTEQLKIISAALEGVPSEAERARIAFQLMGEEGRQLIPLFNAGAEGIDGMVDSIGRIFTREELARAEAYQDALAGMTAATDALVGELVLAAVPALQAVAEWFTRMIGPVSDVFREVGANVGPSFGHLFEVLQKLNVDGGPLLIGWLKASIAPLSAMLRWIGWVTDKMASLIEVGIEVVDWLSGFIDLMETRFPRAFELAGRAITAIMSPLETARKVVAEIFDFLERSFSEVDAIASRVRQIRSTLGISSGEDAPEETAAPSATPSTGAGAAAQARLRAQEREAQVRARIAQEQAANAAAAQVTARAPRRRRGSGGGRGRGAAPAQTDLLADLGLRDPGSVLDGRPAPQQLTIVIAPKIEIGGGMTISITGASGPEQQAALAKGASQARDEIFVKLSDLGEIVAAMFRTQAQAIQAAAGGGRRQPGAG